ERIESRDGKSVSSPAPVVDQKSTDNKAGRTAEAETSKNTAAESRPAAGVKDSSPKSVDRTIQNRQTDAIAAPPSRQAPPKTETQSGKPAKTARAGTTAEPEAEVVIKKMPSRVAPNSAVDGILFYNPRRAYKYWTGPNTGHHTLKEALAALAKMFDRTPEWVARNLGNTNNLGEIYRNLGQSGGAAPAKVQKDMTPKGILFYNPRRPYKYWTSQASRHRSLKEALAALARQYDRPLKWVRTHIGNTNDLAEIHKNLSQRKAAEAEK
ncbi:MAG: hypothetical protein PVI06_20325, partial [Desulfobacterales bacterium]